MISKTITFISESGNDNKEIFVYKWLPDKKKTLRAVIQISHGMAEHAGRYKSFAEVLTSSGFAVYANDHRGHGKTAGSVENAGDFGVKNGFHIAVEDMKSLTAIIKKEYPGLPVFLLGHSMGSLLSRSYIIDHCSEINGVILSGTMGNPGIMRIFGIIISKIECMLRGRNARSSIMNFLIFGMYNRNISPVRTEFDWISRDPDQVNAYINDEYCGFICTAGLYYDLLKGIGDIFKFKKISSIHAKLPVYFISGENDPVGGNNVRGVISTYKNYHKAGIDDIFLKIYPGSRHEMLNEINKNEAYRDIINWLNKHC